MCFDLRFKTLVQERIAKKRDKEEIAEVVPITPHERDQERITKQIVDTPVPSDKGEIAEVAPLIPQERMRERVVEQVMGFLRKSRRRFSTSGALPATNRGAQCGARYSSVQRGIRGGASVFFLRRALTNWVVALTVALSVKERVVQVMVKLF